MPELPVSSPLGYLGVLCLLGGLFLVLTGSGILKIQNVTVQAGTKTWMLGVALITLGALCLQLETSSLMPQPAKPLPTVTAGVTPLALPTNTPKSELPTNTSSPTVVPTEQTFDVAVNPPEQVVKDYFSALNSREYATAWAMLSDHFREERLGCSRYDNYYDCSEYTEWWFKVQRIDNIERISIMEQTGGTAIVYTPLSYRLNDGRVIDDPTPYVRLILDPNTRTWLFYNETSNP